MNKTFRFFISSPFGDFKKERDILHNKVFPKIREYCKEQDFVFQPIDLRWGITESASIDQKTLDICLEEVQISKQYPQPNFLIMVGDRYGSILLPSMIEKEELESLKKYVIDKDFIDIWYKLDENQIPVSYVLQPRLNSENSHDKINYTNRDNWKPVNELLLNILQSASQEAFENEKITEEQKEKYFTSATEAEVIEGIYKFKSITPFQEKNKKLIEEKYIYGYTRTFFKNVEKINVSDEQLKQYFDIKTDNELNSEAFKKAQDFKDEINKILNENVLKKDYKNDLDEYEKDELKEFEEFIIDKLESAIDDEAKRIKNFEKDNNIESIEQEKFLKLKYKNFQGRTATLDQITDFIDNTDKNLLVLHGPSGAGKSSLMAAGINSNLLCDLTNKNLSSKNGYQVVYRFVGATEKTTNIFNLLKSILDELQEKKIIKDIETYEIEEHKFFKQVNDIFSKLDIDEKIVFFIDALDQLDGQINFNWLPEKVSSNLKIVLSLLNDKDYEDSMYYENIKDRDNLQCIDIKKDIFNEKDLKILLKNLLAEEKRKIQNDQETEILKQWKKTDYSPLYIKIAIEKIKHWKSYEKNLKLENDLEKLIENYINNLKKDFHLNNQIVDKVFGYIYASKDGLSESELIDILSEDLTDDKNLRNSIIGDRYEAIITNESRRNKEKEYILPISLWSRLHFQLKPFIIERSIDNQPLMKFFHRQFDKVIKGYFSEKIHEENHSRLASYFINTIFCDRKNKEVPFQYYKSNKTDKLNEFLFNKNAFIINYEKEFDYFVSYFSKIYFQNSLNQEFLQKLVDFLEDFYNLGTLNEVILVKKYIKYFLNSIFEYTALSPRNFLHKYASFLIHKYVNESEFLEIMYMKSFVIDLENDYNKNQELIEELKEFFYQYELEDFNHELGLEYLYIKCKYYQYVGDKLGLDKVVKFFLELVLELENNIDKLEHIYKITSLFLNYDLKNYKELVTSNLVIIEKLVKLISIDKSKYNVLISEAKNDLKLFENKNSKDLNFLDTFELLDKKNIKDYNRISLKILKNNSIKTILDSNIRLYIREKDFESILLEEFVKFSRSYNGYNFYEVSSIQSDEYKDILMNLFNVNFIFYKNLLYKYFLDNQKDFLHSYEIIFKQNEEGPDF